MNYIREAYVHKKRLGQIFLFQLHSLLGLGDHKY